MARIIYLVNGPYVAARGPGGAPGSVARGPVLYGEQYANCSGT